RRTTARLEAVFEASPDMIDVHDAAGTILAVNDRLCEKLGYDEDEIVGKNVTDVDLDRDPEDLRSILDRLERGERHEVEGRFRRRDGSTFPVEVHVRRIDLNDEDRYLVVSRDVTEQRRRERARETVIDRTSDAIVRVDADWRFTFVDGRAEEIYGVEESDLQGRGFWDVFEAALGTPFETAYREAMETREPTTVEAHYDGLDAWFRVRVYPDEGGGLSFYFRDVSERKRLERELERA
ncbi:MAG: PAS domain S-box protein, partial [Halobacteriaceae archaeon]